MFFRKFFDVWVEERWNHRRVILNDIYFIIKIDMLPLIQIMRLPRKLSQKKKKKRLPRKFSLCNFISYKRIHICYLFINFGLKNNTVNIIDFLSIKNYCPLLSSPLNKLSNSMPVKIGKWQQRNQTPLPKTKAKGRKTIKGFCRINSG